MSHLIKKQVFDFRVSSEVDAISLQQRISERFAIDIIPQMEKSFDVYSDEDMILEIEHLEIDLGFITENDIDSGKWSEIFRVKLDEAFKEIIIHPETTGSIKKISAPENAFRQWLFFIENGFLSWNAHKPSADWLLQVLQLMATGYAAVEEARKLLLKDLIYLKRIVLQHNPDFLEHLVEVLTSINQHQLAQQIMKVAGKLYRKKGKHSILANESISSITMRIWIKVLSEAAMYGKEEVFITNLKKSLDGDQSRRIRSYMEDYIWKHIWSETGKGKMEAVTNRTSAESNQPGSELNEAINPQAGKEMTGEEIFIANAGLVLVHPFIHTCFQHLNFVKEGKFAGMAERQRAVCLLHYLVAFELHHPEYELVLPKLLCGWPLHQPLDSQIELTAEEKKEATELLMHLINQWQILKNTSIEALHHNFLQREGKLEFNNDKWHLIIESNSVDVLLEQLPWTIHYIKLPWMSELLVVDWR